MEEKDKGGRPREYDRDFIACELVIWAQKETSINLCEFCAIKMLPPSKITIWAKECERFRKAYELAKCFLGHRREQMLSKEELHVKAYDLNAATYDYFLKEEKRMQAEYEAALKAAQEMKPVSDEEKARHEALMSLLLSMQDSARNKAETNIKADSKS